MLWFSSSFAGPSFRAFLLDRYALGQGRSLWLDSQLDPHTKPARQLPSLYSRQSQALARVSPPWVGAQHAVVYLLRSSRVAGLLVSLGIISSVFGIISWL